MVRFVLSKVCFGSTERRSCVAADVTGRAMKGAKDVRGWGVGGLGLPYGDGSL